METVQGTNINSTGYSAVKLMAYFEKHKLLDIALKLFLSIIHSRPVDVKKYISENVQSIAAEVQSTRTVLLLPPVFDTQQLVKLFEKFYNIPTVVYTKERKPNDAGEILKKFKKFLRHYKWERKHKVFINFPKNCEEVSAFKENNFEPNTVVEIRHRFQIPFKTREMLKTDGARYIKEFSEVEEFFKEVFQMITYGSRAECFEPARDRFNQTVQEIVHQLVLLMRHTTPKRNDHANGRFCHRVIMFGCRGSGRRSQAMALAKRYDLVYINVEMLILETLDSSCPIGEMLRTGLKLNNEISAASAATAIYKRILQKDCLFSGWIIVGFPYNLEGFQLMDKFITPPNKILFLHCRERVGKRRIMKRWERSNSCECTKPGCCKHRKNPRDMIRYIQDERNYFQMQKGEILKYLSTKKETIHVDGNHSFDTVKNFIWARMEQDQHTIGMGFPCPNN